MTTIANETPTEPLTVLLIDDAPSTRRLIRATLESVASLEVSGEADTGQIAIALAGTIQPDVILLDLSLPDADGGEILPELLRAAPDAKIIILSNNSRLAGPDLVRAGATGYIEKGLPPLRLLDQLGVLLRVPLTVTAPLPAFD